MNLREEKNHDADDVLSNVLYDARRKLYTEKMIPV